MAEIAIRKATKSYGKTRVLHGVDLEIANGEFIVILGPSGCGKSTLLRMIAGLEAIDAGEIALGGRVVNDLEPRERGCAMVFQNYALYPHMSVAENIGYALRVAGRPRSERMKRVAEMAAIVGLGDFLDRKPSELSGGQRQRVAMARAMIREPKVFLFDEPLSNLDAKLRVQMRLEIRRLHQRVGATSVFVTHDQIEAMALADRIVVMNAGRIEQIGTPRALYAEPATRFVANFIGSPAMNLIDGEIVAPGRLRLEGGHELAYDPAQFAGQAGQKIEIGIRPEDIHIGGFGANRLAVMVGFIEEMGPSQLAHCIFGALGLAVTLPAGTPERAEHLSLHFPATKLHLFDRESGERLRAFSGALKGVIAA